MKNFLAGFFVAYWLCGFMIGADLKTAVPAENMFGVTYIAFIWPAWLAQPWTGWTPPIPSQSFTFEPRV